MWGEGCWELCFPFGLGVVESKRGDELLVGGGGEEQEGEGEGAAKLPGEFASPFTEHQALCAGSLG